MGNPSIGIDAAGRIGLWSIRCCTPRQMARFDWYSRQNDERWHNVRGWFHWRSQSYDVSSIASFVRSTSKSNMQKLLTLCFPQQQASASQSSAVVRRLLKTSTNLHRHGIHETWISFKSPATTWNILDEQYGTTTWHVHTGKTPPTIPLIICMPSQKTMLIQNCFVHFWRVV